MNYSSAESLFSSSIPSVPCLARSDESVEGSTSPPPTPADMSPYMDAHTYSLPLIDAMPLPRRAETHQSAYHTALPDMMDPGTATTVPIRRVCCIGAGYVGGPTAAVMALHNPQVRITVVDRDEGRISAWKSKHLPIHEPGLVEVVRAARDGIIGRKEDFREQSTGTPAHSCSRQDSHEELARMPNLFFSTACAQTIATSDMVLISVNTPTKRRGVGAGRATDMTALEGAVRDVAMHARPGTILVEKSTVPCKTGQLIKDILEVHRPGVTFPVLSNPEFLSEGTAVRDLMCPDRVILGCESTIAGHRAAAALVNLYAAWVPRSKILPINIWSSELCKLTANAMLAQRISSINSISAICERTGADVTEIAKSIGMDARIGPQFLKAGLGFGGSCFRKDIASLTYLAESLGLPEVAEYWQQVITMNNLQRDRFARLVISSLNNTLRGKKIAILGYAFKKDTGDARESPALDVIRILLDENPKNIAIFDPLCSKADITHELCALEASHDIMQPSGPVEIVPDAYTACADSHAVLVLTDWDMFKIRRTVPSAEKVETHQFDGAAPTTILRLRYQQEKAPAPVSKPPTPPQTPKLNGLPWEVVSRLAPEPVCPSDCTECISVGEDSASETKDTITPVDWLRISHSVKEPKWVFDGRGVLESNAMIGMGFRLETLGRASLY